MGHFGWMGHDECSRIRLCTTGQYTCYFEPVIILQYTGGNGASNTVARACWQGCHGHRQESTEHAALNRFSALPDFESTPEVDSAVAAFACRLQQDHAVVGNDSNAVCIVS